MRSFLLFLTVFLGLYALLHAYAYFKLLRFFSLKRPWTWALPLLFSVFLLLPVLGHLLGARGMEGPSAWVLLMGYEWMALLFLFVSAQVAADLLRLTLFGIGRAVHGFRMPARTAGVLFVAASVAALGAFGYGHFEARDLRVNRVEFRTSKLPAGVERLRIAQVSDLHFSAVNTVRLAESVARAVEEAQPDLLVATGDLVDRGMEDAEAVARAFRDIETPLGKLAVLGNHEFYRGVKPSVGFLERAGFRVLRGEAAAPVPWLHVLGVDDEAAARLGGPRGAALEDLLRTVPKTGLVLVLRHRPRVPEAARGRFDLQLSGHTHGGQIFPFGLVVARAYPFLKGTYDVGKGSRLHVNRGTGTWGPPIRVGSPPEITLIEYSRKD